MSLSLQQYEEVLTLALDHQLTKLKGGFVLDDFDPAVEGDRILRARIKRLVRQKNINQLEKMLNDLIEWFRFKDEYNFASVLYQKTGYKIEPIPRENISISTRPHVDT